MPTSMVHVVARSQVVANPPKIGRDFFVREVSPCQSVLGRLKTFLSLSRYTEGVSNMFVHALTPSELGDTAPNVTPGGHPQREISSFHLRYPLGMSPSPIFVEISSYELQKCLNHSETFTNRSEIQFYVSLVLENFFELYLSSEIFHFRNSRSNGAQNGSLACYQRRASGQL